MRRTALVAVVLTVIAACSPAGTGTTTTTAGPAEFPVTVEADNGPVDILERPNAIISLSPTATEMLFAIGAGDRVVAVDDQSNYPAGAPMTDLSGFTPNLEAVLAYEPDLVVISYDPGDLIAGLEAVGVPTLLLGGAFTIDDVYTQIEAIGTATGDLAAARSLNVEIQGGIDAIVAESAGSGAGVTFYHELDSTFYSVTSSTFIGQIYALLGLVNISDAADPDDVGYPQLSAEYIVTEDPGIIFLADGSFGVTAESIAQRPGWEGMSALANDAVVTLDEDIASRWGPRIVDFLQAVADAVERLSTGA